MSIGLEVKNPSGQTIFSSQELQMRHVKTVTPNREIGYVMYTIKYFSWQGSLTENALLSAILPEGSFYSFALVRRGEERFPTRQVPSSHNLAVLSIVERGGSSAVPTFYIFDKAPGVDIYNSFGIVTYSDNGSVTLSSSSPLLQVLGTTTTPVVANFSYLPTAYAGNLGTALISVDNLFYSESDGNRLELRVKRLGTSFYMQANYEIVRTVGDRTHKIRTTFIDQASLKHSL